MKNKNKGFTLIELLVVIAIIAILSTVVMAGLNSARAKGRDAKRLSDIKQVQAALELFYDSCGGYPGNASGVMAQGTASGGAGLGVAQTVGCPAGTTFGNFMATIPVNPGPNGTNYTYCSKLSATASTFSTPGCAVSREAYAITFTLEGPSGSLATGGHVATPSGII